MNTFSTPRMHISKVIILKLIFQCKYIYTRSAPWHIRYVNVTINMTALKSLS